MYYRRASIVLNVYMGLSQGTEWMVQISESLVKTDVGDSVCKSP
jgi:hypothetical protein